MTPMTRWRAGFALLIAMSLAPPPAFAQDDLSAPGGEYLYDGGAIPFLYLPIATILAAKLLMDTPETPRLFSPAEGGEPSLAHRQVPKWVIDVIAVGMVASMPLYGEQSRWFHAKGMVQSIACTTAVTELTKRAFGRHRPDAVPFGPNPPSDRRSFFSGHASTALAATTYYALFLRNRGLERFRDHGQWPWWELVAYGGLAGASALAVSERVIHHRHHVTDALVGAGVGAAIAIALFRYQDSRYESAVTSESSPGRITLPLLTYGGSF
jgi:membrane-associated phospholipid phosphatase